MHKERITQCQNKIVEMNTYCKFWNAWNMQNAGVKFVPFSSLFYTPNHKPRTPKPQTPNPKALTRKGCKFDFCYAELITGHN